MNSNNFITNFVDAFKFIGRNGELPGEPHFPTLLYYSVGTLKIAVIAMVISMVIALPIGLWLGHIHRGSFVAINLGNIWRALPSLAVLAIGFAFLGHRAEERAAGAGRAGGAADHHQRVRGRRTRSIPTWSTRPAAWE